jgi:hypothetical protein
MASLKPEDGHNQRLPCFRDRAFVTFLRLLPTFLTAFLTADADLRVFFAVYLTS